MHIVILCATQRGYRFAEHLMNVGRGHRFTVFSFRETAWEPPFLDDIEQLARQHNHSFYETRNVAHSKWDTFWREAAVDLLLMVGWRYLVPAKVYHRARRGAFVFHDSLLPTYRGFAPTVWAMVNGESQTGATLFRVAEDVDAGDIVDQRAIAIGFDETIADVIEHVTQAYLDMIERNFTSLLGGIATGLPQKQEDATYTCKWTPADGLIDWRKPALEIYNLVRATSRPYPGAFTYLDNRKLTIWSAAMPANPRQYVSRVPGRVAEVIRDVGSLVLTGDGGVLLKDVQLEGEEVAKASSVLNSLSQTLGDRKR